MITPDMLVPKVMYSVLPPVIPEPIQKEIRSMRPKDTTALKDKTASDA